MKALLALNPEVVVLEPTGGNYAKLWAIRLAEAGCMVFLVGHKELRRYRENMGLPDKDDPADALALACYYLEHQASEQRFVRTRDPVVAQIRERVLQLNHLNRLQSPVVNRVKQYLAWQFPERMHTGLDAAVFWGWLAGEQKSSRYDRELAESVGTGPTEETRADARMIRELQRREQRIEKEMRELMRDARFLPYRAVFTQFGFGERVQALILSQIYPLENYLKEGKPEVRIRQGKVSGKPTKRHLSRRRFQKALGVAPVREESGDTKKKKKAGSQLCRTALWQWVFTRIEVKRSRPKTKIGERLYQDYTREKQVKPIKLARSRLYSRAVTLLFYELVRAIS